MYAVVKTGGKQYRVAKDDKIVVDRLIGEDGDSVVLDQVLMMADGDKVTVGSPVIEGAAVGATVLRQTLPSTSANSVWSLPMPTFAPG